MYADKDIASLCSVYSRALAIQQEASDMGFEWPNAEGILDKIIEEAEEIRKELRENNSHRLKREIGDLYMVSLHLAQYLHLDPLECLSIACEAFQTRWNQVRALVTQLPTDSAERLAYLEGLWTQVKQNEQST